MEATLEKVKTAFTTFNPVRNGFYRNIDVYYFINNLFHSLEFAGINIVKIMHIRHLKTGVDRMEVLISNERYDHKLTVLIEIDCSLSFHLEMLACTSTTFWEKVDHKSNISIKDWNEKEFKSIVNLIKIGSGL